MIDLLKGFNGARAVLARERLKQRCVLRSAYRVLLAGDLQLQTGASLKSSTNARPVDWASCVLHIAGYLDLPTREADDKMSMFPCATR